MNDFRSSPKTLTIIGVILFNLLINASGQTLDCNFEQDFCNWQNYTSVGAINWNRGKTSNSQSPGSFPVGDHTFGKDGFYAYIGNSPIANSLTRSKIISPSFTKKSESDSCFSVWYFIHGASLPTFNIYLMTNTVEETSPRFTKIGSQGRGWNLARVDLSLEYQKNYKIIIDGLPGNTAGLIAIDDANFKDEPCEQDEITINCDFETDFICGYKNDRSVKMSWVRFTGQTITVETGPPNDVTTGTIYGHFMLFEPSTPSTVANDKAVLITPTTNDASGKGCLEFYYNANGIHVNVLNVYLNQTSGKTKIFTTSGDQGRPWRVARLNVVSNNNFQILFEAIKGSAGTRGDIGLDEIKYLENKVCPNVYECNFDESCTWQDVTDPKVVQEEWDVNIAGTSVTGLGPKNDSQGNPQGYYAFLEPTAPARIGDKAQLMSAVVDAAYCLKFAYYMNGPDVGTINIYTRLINVSATRPLKLRWTLTGQQGSKWLYAQVPFPYEGPYFTFIEGVVGKGYQAYMAIDQISITKDTACKLTPVAAQPSDTSSIQCSFEKDTCGWYPDTSLAGFQFVRKQGIFRLNGTGPFVDHTLQASEGWYMSAETENRKNSEKARIISDAPVNNKTTGCFTFWYHMYGLSITTLKIYARKSDGTLNEAIWTKTGNQGNKWIQGKITTKSLTYNSFLTFEVTVTNGEKGHVALDDFSYSNSPCPVAPSSINCNFEDDLCGYLSDVNLDYVWKQFNGSSTDLNITDHTVQTVYGNFLTPQKRVSTSNPTNKLARLVSVSNSTNGTKCLGFYYNMFGNDKNKLEVILNAMPNTFTIWSKQIDTQKKWVKELVNFNSFTRHQIWFEATAEGSIALDDIEINDGPCPNYGDCNFENEDLCLWESDTEKAKLQWIVNSGATPTFGTGPSTDHTFGTSKGRYIYVKSIGIEQQEYARIKSYAFEPTTQAFCFEFWYHMVGRNILSLNVYQYFENRQEEKLIWTLSGQQATYWTRATIPLSSTERFSLIVEGFADQDPQSDIALDDFVFFNSFCQYTPSTAIPSVISTTPMTTSTRTFKPITTTPTSFDCDFENGLCGWTLDPSQPILWQRKKASTSSSAWQPSTDYSLGTSDGSYLLVDTSLPNQKGQKARIKSPVLSKSSSSVHCVYFALFMYGDEVGVLNSYLDLGDNGAILYYNLNGSQSNNWQLKSYEFSFNLNVDLSIVFEGIVGNGARGSIAIDDVRIQDGSCEKTVCDFENEDLCQYINDPTASFKWIRKSGLNDFTGITPSIDHTLGTQLGNYMSIDFTNVIISGSTARLLTPFQEGPSKCLQFYYHMRGNERCTLDVLVAKETGPLSQSFWSRNKNYGNQWNIAELTVKSTGKYRIAFQGTVGDNWIGDIAIDDVKIENRECASAGFCDFESDQPLCTWENLEGNMDDFDWELGSVFTSTSGTGPSVDHTFGNSRGNYLFIETSPPRKENDKAILSSMILESTNSRCLRFWYHMNGAGIGTLQIDIIYDNNFRETIWKLSKDQGDQWLQGTVGINSKNMTYRIYMIGIRGKNDLGDIAIDDISFVENSCGIQPIEVLNELAALTTLAPTTTRPLASREITCSFDNNNKCGWTDDSSAPLKWILNKGQTNSSDTGPVYDVSGDGYYIYLETSGVNNGDAARIISQYLNSSFSKTTNCLTFYYHMYGETIGELNVKLMTSLGLQDQALWTRNDQHGNVWLKAHLNLNPLPNNLEYKIVFEAVAGKSYTGDVAIDEIEFIPNRRCPPISELGSLVTFSCDFEDDLCGFIAENTTNKNKWQRAKPIVALFSDNPAFDNTLQTRDGYYLQSQPVFATNLTSRITSVNFDPNTNGRCLNFYMFTNAAATPSLRVYSKSASKPEKLIIEAPSLQSNNWVNLEIEIPEEQEEYNIIFESVSKYLFAIGYANLGIDDFAIKKGPCRKHPGDCTFEFEGLCSWYNAKNDDFDWLLHQGGTPTPTTGPSIDHTFGNSNGTFVYIETSIPRTSNQLAWLVSETLSPTNSICFTFWYNAFGSTVGSLKLYYADANATRQNVIWEITGQQSVNSRDWKQGVVALSNSNDFKLIFEGRVGGVGFNSFDGDIAIDDIAFLVDSPTCVRQPPFSEPTTRPPTVSPGQITDIKCDFETNFCGWTQTTDSTTNWVRKTGKTYGGPKFDHTFGTKEAYYAYFEKEDDWYDYYGWGWGSSFTERSKLKSPKITGDSKQCLTFWYYMYGSRTGELSVYLNIEKQPNVFVQSPAIWKMKNSHGDHWNLAHVQYDGFNSSVVNFIIEGYAGYYSSGEIAIDDIDFNYGDCEDATYTSVTCDFEEDHICGYQPDPKADFNWARNRGITLSDYTGPTFDVTTGTEFGYYMYIETTPQSLGQKARLVTPSQSYKDGKCLYFWYHAYGKDVGALNIYSELQNQTSRNLLWTISRDQGNQWLLARLPTDYQTDFKIIFEGVVGKSWFGDVAIDDVYMSKNSCPNPFNCDFENDEFDFCSWINVNNSINEDLQNGTLDHFDWILHSSEYDFSFGLVPDNTFEDYHGHFMLSNGKKLGHFSRIISENMPKTSDSGVCITFYYYFSLVSSLNLTVSLVEYKKSPLPVWSLKDSQTIAKFWRLGQFYVKTNDTYKIFIDGFAGTDNKQFIGVDDIEIKPATSSCITIPSQAGSLVTTTSTSTTTTTTQPSIIELDCDFEQTCLWSNSNNNKDTNWTISRAMNINEPNAPLSDHTLGNNFGSYLTLEKRSYFNRSTVNFVSPEMNATKCVEFWYYMYGPEVGTLSMYRQVSGVTTPSKLWTSKDSSSSDWRFAQASINYLLPETKYSARIEFTFNDQGFSGFVAVDDIIVHEGFCQTTDLCTFENPDLCGYKNDPLADFEWIRANASASNQNTGPSNDHTFESPDGNFMLFDASKQKSIARLISPSQVKSSGSCVHFYYNTNGLDVGSLKVYSKIGNSLSNPLWTTIGNSGDKWSLAEVTLKSPDSTWQVVFEGQRGNGNNGNMAIDDVRITKGDCPSAGDCNFEDKTLCNYKNSEDSKIKWVVKQGSISFLTGPSSDHTFGTSVGSYAMFITDSPSVQGWIGRMESQPLEYISTNVCVKFWYYMYANLVGNLGTLNILLIDTRTNDSRILWSLTNSQGTEWREGRFSYFISNRHRIVFEGIRGAGRGDIALDDITFTSASSCNLFPNYASPNVTVTTVATTTRQSTTLSTYNWNPVSEYDCNFENDYCLWKNDPTANFNWIRAWGNNNTLTYGPNQDHTYQNKTGHYIRIDPYKPSNQKCRLESPEITDLKDRCLEFYYYAYGSDINSLNVYVKENGQLGLPRWTRVRNQGRDWQRAELRVKNQRNSYQIVIEGVVGTYVGVIAVDDIRVLADCPPKTGRFCDFESDEICGYTYGNGNIDWKRGSKATAPSTGPSIDHSLGTESGNFMYVSGTSSNQIQRGLLSSNVINPNSEQCVEFYYYHAPASIGSLNIYAKLIGQSNSSGELPLWTEPFVNNGFNGWQLAQVSLGHAITNLPYQIIFEEYVSANKPGNDFNIYLDDVLIRDSSCLPPGDCDFENGFCSWSSINSEISNTNWVVSTGDSSDNFRPLNDHSTGSSYGGYAFVESASSGNVAFMTSQIFSTPTSYRGRCLTFWYYISGTNPGSILIYVKNLRSNTNTLIWKDGNEDKGQQWNYGQFGFFSDSEYTIIIEGISGSQQSSVSIDDIFFKDSQFCSVSPTSAAVGPGLPIPSTTTTTTKSPTSTPAPSIYDCNFEIDYCNWKNDSSRPLTWLRNQGRTTSEDTGAEIDHTLGNEVGWYIYIETSTPSKQNDTARLISPNFAANSINCLTFYYHMRGKTIGTLNVYTKTQSNESVVWSKKGNQGNKWLTGKLNLNLAEDYTIIFEGVAGNGAYGDISLDDLSITNGYCQTNDLFNCDFERDLCGFVQDPTGKINWTRKIGNGNINSGPGIDHTTNSPKGYYMVLDVLGAKNRDQARLLSPKFNFIPEGYCLKWFYHMAGIDMGKLTVYIQVEEKKGLLWRFGENVGKIWNGAQLSILPISDYKNFSIIFEGERAEGSASYMALDDIILENGACQSYGGCTFDGEDYCFWDNIEDKRDDFDWEFGTFATGTANTGPPFDHTTGDSTGSYLFIETNPPFQQGNKAILESSLFLPTPSYGLCFDFWYHMYGIGMGTLNIYSNSTNSSTLLWSQSGNKGNVWLNGQVNIISARSFRIFIEGIKGPNARSDIALDDFDFIERPCNIFPESADPSFILTTASTQPTTLTTRPIGSTDCNFENDLCIWTQSRESTFNWTRSQGKLGNQ
ncbi:unnamed protein product, partial [Brachionus calyciflorus]